MNKSKIKIGDVNGYLKVEEIYYTKNKKGKEVLDKKIGCICLLCKKHIVINRSNFLGSVQKSCGCLKNNNSSERIAQMNSSLTYIDGTCVEMISSNKMRRNNTSGVKGVSFNVSKNKWQACICVSGKAMTKRFDNFNDAVKQRKEWEEELFKPIIEKAKEIN